MLSNVNLRSTFTPVRNKKGNVISLGEGTFSNVFLVKDEFGNEFACKECTRENFLEYTVDEVDVMKKLNDPKGHSKGHPNIVALIDTIPRSIGFDIVMQKCDGSLYDLLENSHKKNGFGISETVLLDLVDDMIDALLYIRSKRVSHCDLKPQNILYVKDDTRNSGYRFILVDFGNAEECERAYKRIQTNHYRCIENLLDENDCDIQSCDFFSLGCIVYEAITYRYLIDCDDDETDRQIRRSLQLIGSKMFYENKPEESEEDILETFVKKIKGDGCLDTDGFLLKAFEKLEYKHRQKWIDFIKNMIIPFPLKRLLFVKEYRM
jgi:serine/threonine protein kinase